jgi:hypothetical protein
MEKAFGFNQKGAESVSSPFQQQKLPAWQPVLSTKIVVIVMLVIGLVALPIGIGLLVSTENVS